jgi:hypothetical protein
MDDICGDHFTGPTGIEWICVDSKNEHLKNVEGGPSHYYVRRHAVQPEDE